MIVRFVIGDFGLLKGLQITYCARFFIYTLMNQKEITVIFAADIAGNAAYLFPFFYHFFSVFKKL